MPQVQECETCEGWKREREKVGASQQTESKRGRVRRDSDVPEAQPQYPDSRIDEGRLHVRGCSAVGRVASLVKCVGGVRVLQADSIQPPLLVTRVNPHADGL